MKEQTKDSAATLPLFVFLLAFVGVFLYIGIEMTNVISLANLSVLLGVSLVALSGYSLARPAAVCQDWASTKSDRRFFAREKRP